MSKLTRKEFEVRYAAYSKAMLVPSIILLLSGLAVAIWWDSSDVGDRSYIVSAFVIGVGVIAFWYLDGVVPKKYGLDCPLCKKSMVRFLRFRKHIDRGYCPRCRESIFEAKSAE